jgi:hypothetical protein
MIRYLKNISVKIDQAVVREESQSAFNGLDFDGKVKIKIDFYYLILLLFYSFMLVEYLIIWNVE